MDAIITNQELSLTRFNTYGWNETKRALYVYEPCGIHTLVFHIYNNNFLTLLKYFMFLFS